MTKENIEFCTNIVQELRYTALNGRCVEIEIPEKLFKKEIYDAVELLRGYNLQCSMENGVLFINNFHLAN